MRFQRTFALATALLVSGGLAGCSLGPVDLGDFIGTPSVEEAHEERRAELAPVVADSSLKQAGTLTVGIPTDQTAPLAMTVSDGAQSGIDIDVAHALADELGLSSVTFVAVDDAESALAETCDVVMGVELDEAEKDEALSGMAERYPVCRGLAPWIGRVVEAHRAEKSESSLENVSTKGGVTEAMTTALRGGSTLAGSIAAGLARCAEISAELAKRFAAHAA